MRSIILGCFPNILLLLLTGFENHYAEAMKRLEQFYGDKSKVVKCVMHEVKARSAVSEDDYRQLIEYSDILHNNFNRLTSLNLQHEMSNTSVMSIIVKKFPRAVEERWHEHLLDRSPDDKAKPFPVFIAWLTRQKEKWACMVSSDDERTRSDSHYADEARSVVDRQCFGCGESGHIRRNCPKNKSNSKDVSSRPRKATKVKKYWCALHKDDKTKKCYSNSCADLRKMSDSAQRISLLKDNKDCTHCCGDHKAEECHKKDRICGGGKADRGCSRSHQMHELYCSNAKVCMMVTASMTVYKDAEGVILCIMKVRAPRGLFASVFWDSGSSSNFIREQFAKLCGFKGRTETLSVTTLGGKVTDYLTVTLYTCTLLDESGTECTFQAYGLESITGVVSQISSTKLRKFFPRSSDKLIELLRRGSVVDFLIGMLHPSWHPDRAEKAAGGGDLWIYRGRFGACVGGRHPEINERTRRSEGLFNVNHTYFTDVSVAPFPSHELEYCPARMLERYEGSLERLHGVPSRIKNVEDMNIDIHNDINSIHDREVISHDVAVNVVRKDVVTTADSEDVAVLHREYSDPIPFQEDSDPIPFQEDSDLIPNRGDSVPIPYRGDSVPIPYRGDSVPIPYQEYSDSTSYRGDSDPISYRKDSDPIPYRSNSDPIPYPVVIPIQGDSNPQSGDVDPPVHGVDDAAVNVGEVTWHVAESWIEDDGAVAKASQLSVHAASFTPGDHEKSASDKGSRALHSVVCAVALACPFTQEQFFQAEALGTVVEPQCGGCKCSRCPVPGSQFSFKEQKEFDAILKNLKYDKEKKRWFTSYPWRCDRSVLPRNDKAALKLLQSLERSLLKKPPELSQEYCEQIHDMVERGVAVLLSEEVLNSWDGDYYYLPIVGVKGKKALRVCFDAARKQCGCPSMNDCLCKGPDRFMNNLLSVILNFRNGRIGCAADIKKFHNQVHLFDKDIHMQRFLWRDMDTTKPPQTYAVVVNNFGVKPANCIATCALRNSADQFSSVYPTESEEVKFQTYIDDGLTAASSKAEALVKTQRWDEIWTHASMPNKGWIFSGDDRSGVDIGGDETDIEKVLGLSWDPKSDYFLFKAKLHVKIRLQQGGYEDIEISTVEELLQFRDDILNRRVLLSNVHSIFDPPGLLAPLLLQAKLLMRESWTGPNPVGWDDLLPESQCERWIEFLSALLDVGELWFPRSLWPEEEVIGLPVLIVFSDGSLLAFGAAAYIRWELKAGGYWTCLIMAKSKIAPKNILSIPRMELIGALLGNRIKNSY